MAMTSTQAVRRPSAPHAAASPVPAEEPSAMAAAAAVFRSLGDPVRLLIVQHLMTGEHRVVDLTAHLGLAQSTVSAHLACLRDCGLVVARAEGRSSFHSLAHPELVELLRSAERLLAVTGDAVVLCPTADAGAGAGAGVGGQR